MAVFDHISPHSLPLPFICSHICFEGSSLKSINARLMLLDAVDECDALTDDRTIGDLLRDVRSENTFLLLRTLSQCGFDDAARALEHVPALGYDRWASLALRRELARDDGALSDAYEQTPVVTPIDSV